MARKHPHHDGPPDGEAGPEASAPGLSASRQASQRRERVLQAVAEGTAWLSEAPSLAEGTQRLIHSLIDALDVGRGFVLQITSTEEGEGDFVTTVCHCSRDEAHALTDVQIRQQARQARSPLGPWLKQLSQGMYIAGQAKSFPPAKQEYLASVGIQSIALLPIFVEGALWGVLGFSDLARPRPWSLEELDALRTTAFAIGEALRIRRTEQQLRDSKRQLQHILDNSRDLIFRNDMEGNITYINRAAETLTGYRIDEMMQMNLFEDLLAPEQRADLRERFQRRKQRESFEGPYSCQLVRRDGARLDMEVVATPVTVHGEVVALQGIARDVTERRRAEEHLARQQQALEESRRRFQEMADLLPTVITECDKDFRFTYVNQAGLDTFGYTVEDVQRGVSIWEVAHPEDHELAKRRIQRLLAGEDLGLLEYRMITRDGQTLTCLLKTSLLTDADGNFAGLRTSLTDISDLKQTQQALLASQQRFQQTADMLPTSIFETDRDLVITYANQAARKAFGFTAEELARGVSVWEGLAPEDLPHARRRVDRLLEGKEGQVVEYRLRRRDGQIFYALLKGSGIFREGTFQGLRISLTDVTELRAAQQALKRSEEKYRALVEDQTELIASSDAQHRVTFANEAYCRFMGRPREELLGKSFLPMIPAQDRNRVQEVLRQITPDSSTVSVRHRVTRADGQVRWLEWTARQFFDKSGERTGLQAVGRDITERVRAEQALQQASRQLVNAREAERRHLAGELHDAVGQSLVALRLGLQGLLADADADQASRVNALAGQVNTLIREVRQIGHGLYPPTLESLGLYPALRQLCDHYRHSPVDVHAEAQPPADRSRLPSETEIALFRVAQEALSNAVQHAGCTRVTVACRQVDDWFELTVQDDGQGFQPGHSPRGLGLNSMYQRLNAVSGRLDIDSGEKGTRVIARVPLPVDEPPPAEPT